MFILVETRPVGRSNPWSAVNTVDSPMLADICGEPFTLFDRPLVLDLPNVGIPVIGC